MLQGLFFALFKLIEVTKRRKLPAPPLILSPYLIRLHEVSPKVEQMLRLARFLDDKKLLTDGGRRNLEEGFVGRNERRSLSAQDVRGWAHALVLELWEKNENADDWETICEEYFCRFDRGKPRKPNHLQRLCLEWSPDLHWTGLLATAFRHPFLWGELELAVSRLDAEHAERRVLEVALRAKDEPLAWCEAWEGRAVPRSSLLRLWRVLANLSPDRRVQEIGQRVDEVSPRTTLGQLALESVLLSSSQARRLEVAVDVMGRLELFSLQVLSSLDDFVTPTALAAFRGFVTDPETTRSLERLVGKQDPVRRVTFGPRPGQNWFSTLLKELQELSELRSLSSSR